MVQYNKQLKPNARDLRSNMTQVEKMLWSKIRYKQLNGIQFYRQRAIATFIVDFYAPKVKLVIEVDGSQHLEEDHIERDKLRDVYLNDLGILVLRFDNLEAMFQLNSVVERIVDVMEAFAENGAHKNACQFKCRKSLWYIFK